MMNDTEKQLETVVMDYLSRRGSEGNGFDDRNTNFIRYTAQDLIMIIRAHEARDVKAVFPQNRVLLEKHRQLDEVVNDLLTVIEFNQRQYQVLGKNNKRSYYHMPGWNKCQKAMMTAERILGKKFKYED